MKRVVTAQVQSQKLVSDRRGRIIRAAISVFHRQGYHSTTTGDIAREAGLTQSNLYNYVKSKQDVLFLVCDELVGTYGKLVDAVCEEFTDPYSRLVESLKAVIGAMSEFRDEVQLLYNETHSLEKPDRVIVMASISGFISRFENLLSEYADAHKVAVSDMRLAANLVSFVPAIVALRSWDLAQHNSSGHEDEIVEFVLRGLGLPVPNTT